jgi:signal transduction histidine kinase
MSNSKKTQSFYHVMVEEAIAGIMAFRSSDYKCVYANQAAKQLIDYNQLFNSESEHSTDLDIKKLFPKVDLKKAKELGFTPLNFNLLIHEGIYQAILVNKGKNQQLVANVGVKKVELEGEEHILMMIQDTTVQNKLQRDVLQKQNELKSAYEELVQQNEKLKSLDKAKDRFIALTTHELRTPASAMLATADVLKEGLYDTEEELKMFIDTIHEQGHHLMELINDILDFSKIQAGMMDYYVQQLDINKLLKDVIKSAQSTAQKSNIKLNLESNQQPLLCYYDELRIKQVLQNVLSNAMKYNKENGFVKIWLKEKDSEVEIHIQDSGVGIPPEEQSKVFDEFETLGKVALHHQGTGLGMPISKQMIESMGGNIDFSSEVGVGTTFIIRIPKNKVLDEENYRERPTIDGDLIAS